MAKNILLINPTIQPIGVDLLEKECNLFYAPNGEEETLINSINNYNIDAVITRVEKITRNVIQNCKTLKVIGQHGVGLDNIDVKAASEFGVKVLNVPDANYNSVGEHTVMLILSLSRDLIIADENVRQGNWRYRDTNIPIEIANKNLLIIGFGRIGRDVARKAMGFNMNILAYDSFVDEDTMMSLNVKKIYDLSEGLKDADFVTIHAPLTNDTKGLISDNQFKVMKKTAYILNLGRGPVIDETALIEALENKEIAGAGLDVFELEPPDINNPLLKFKNVIVTPHFAGDTKEAKGRCSSTLAKTVIDVLNGNKTYNLVN